MTLGKIETIAISGPAMLTVVWDNQRRADVDLGPLIAARANLAPLADRFVFATAAISDDGWAVEWPVGIDFGSAQLRRWADEQIGETMPSAGLRTWMERHDLTLDTAAAALGLSRRTIAYYLSGEQVIPKTVMLATEGYDARRAA
ncbi:helix-turn-helix domain-containing protein [Sphingomonas gilva]|nr:helix-turn-helix transcriptional regulator [Sphingomonas gilva]